MSFPGYPAGTLEFLRGLRANNNRDWFKAHDAAYKGQYVEPAKDFVVAAGESEIVVCISPTGAGTPSWVNTSGAMKRWLTSCSPGNRAVLVTRPSTAVSTACSTTGSTNSATRRSASSAS